MKNVHIVVLMFIGNSERFKDFFDQSFIRGSETADEEEEPLIQLVG